MNPWQSLQALALDRLAMVPRCEGVYQISAGRPLNRVVGADKVGILEIGETDNLRRRLRDFVLCATGVREKGHSAGCRYAHFGFARHFPFRSLRVRWEEKGSKPEAHRAEHDMMEAYTISHCELPPLNNSFNWQDVC